MFLEKFKWLVDRSRLFDNMNAKDTMEINVSGFQMRNNYILASKLRKKVNGKVQVFNVFDMNTEFRVSNICIQALRFGTPKYTIF